MRNDIAEIKENICDLKIQLNEIKEQYIKINVHLDKIHKKLTQPIIMATEPGKTLEIENLLKAFTFPITEFENILLMEEKIKSNPEFKKQLVSFYNVYIF